MAKTGLLAGAEEKCLSVAAEMGYELVEVTVDKENTGKYLRVYIDKPEGISLDDCERFHRAVQHFFDDVDYDFMEVSSPGVDRPLKKDRDFERALGSEVEVHLFRAMDGTKILNGVLAGLENGEILLETGGVTRRVNRKDAALVRPVVDMSGVEEVDLSENGEDFGDDMSGEDDEA